MKKPSTVEDAMAALLRLKEGYAGSDYVNDVDLIMGVLKRLERAVEHAAHAEKETRQMMAIAKTVLKDE